MEQNVTTLFERLGGKEAVETAVDIFYGKVLADDRVNYFFDKTNMVKQRAKQKAFLTFAFGGPNNYSGKNMRDGHTHLIERGLNDSHVDAIIELLDTTLKELGVSDEDVAEVAAIANGARDDVLNR